MTTTIALLRVIINLIADPFILHAANDPFIRILPETRRKILDNPGTHHG